MQSIYNWRALFLRRWNHCCYPIASIRPDKDLHAGDYPRLNFRWGNKLLLYLLSAYVRVTCNRRGIRASLKRQDCYFKKAECRDSFVAAFGGQWTSQWLFISPMSVEFDWPNPSKNTLRALIFALMNFLFCIFPREITPFFNFFEILCKLCIVAWILNAFSTPKVYEGLPLTQLIFYILVCMIWIFFRTIKERCIESRKFKLDRIEVREACI